MPNAQSGVKKNQYLGDSFSTGDIDKHPTESIQHLRKELKKYPFSIGTQRAVLLTKAYQLHVQLSKPLQDDIIGRTELLFE